LAQKSTKVELKIDFGQNSNYGQKTEDLDKISSFGQKWKVRTIIKIIFKNRAQICTKTQIVLESLGEKAKQFAKKCENSKISKKSKVSENSKISKKKIENPNNGKSEILIFFNLEKN